MLPVATQSWRNSMSLQLPVNPAIGLIGTIVGTVLAVALLPFDPQPVGSLRLSGLCLAAGLMLAPAVSCLRNPRAIFRIEHILVLSPIYWLLFDLVQGTFPLPGIEYHAARKAFLMIGLFVCSAWVAIWAGLFRLPGPLRQVALIKIPGRVVFGLILLLFGLAMLKFAIPSGFDPVRMMRGLTQPRWGAPWSRGALGGGLDAVIDHLSYFGYVVPSLTVLLSTRVGWRDARTVIAVACSIILLLFLAQSGGRRIIGVVYGAALIYWVLLQPRLRPSTIVKFVLFLVLLLTIFQFMLAYRKAGFGALSVRDERINVPDQIRVDDNFYRLSQIIMLFPERHDFVYHKQIVFAVIRPVPRALWPGKPTLPGYNLPAMVGKRGVSLTSSVLGELYACAGILGILFGGLFYGSIARMTSPILNAGTNPERFLVYALCALVIFAGMRSMLELVLMSYAIFAWVAAVWLISPSRK